MSATRKPASKRIAAQNQAAAAALPPSNKDFEDARRGREYYGSISHNTKAIYQRYMGWFDGNPAHLWEHPPVEQARRYVEFIGAENATWRNFFLMGAQELREGIAGTPTATAPPDVLSRLTVGQLLDAMSIRLDGPRAPSCTCASTGPSPTPTRSTRSRSVAASCATALAATAPRPTPASSSHARR